MNGHKVYGDEASERYRDHACVTIFYPKDGERVLCGICKAIFYGNSEGYWKEEKYKAGGQTYENGIWRNL